jgi:hypothetical protein
MLLYVVFMRLLCQENFSPDNLTCANKLITCFYQQFLELYSEKMSRIENFFKEQQDFKIYKH